MKRDAVLKLSKILQEATGVSLLQFDKEAVNLRMQEIIRFPSYTYSSIALPAMLIFALVIASTIAFCIAGHYSFALIFFILGSFFALINGTLFGVLVFVKKIESEVKATYELIVKQVKVILLEISIADEDTLESYIEIPPLEDVIRGMSQIIGLPFIEKQVYKHLSYFPSIILDIVQTVFDTLLSETDYLLQNEYGKKTEQPNAVGEMNPHIAYSQNGLIYIEKLLRDKHILVNKGIDYVAFATKVIAFFTCSFLGLLIGIIYLLMV